METRLPTAERPGSPIVFLAGGPGVPGIGMGRVPVYFRLFQQLRSVSDVILLDQRGLGMSSPALDCPATPVPADAFASSANWLSVITSKSRSCADHWRARSRRIGLHQRRLRRWLLRHGLTDGRNYARIPALLH